MDQSDLYQRKYSFQNPLRQNYKHTKTLSELTGIPEDRIRSVVIFVGSCQFKTSMPPNMVDLVSLVPYVKSFRTPVIKDEQVPEIVSVILAWVSTVTGWQKASHIAHLRAKKLPRT
ncbi:MAG: nuclease-related domain-containing protein [Kiritimatiellia bacterium]